MTVELAVLLAAALCAISIAAGVYSQLQWRKSREATNIRVALANRFPLLLKMDKLADHDLLALVNDAPDDILQAAALGIAALAATGNKALEELVATKAAFLSGEMTEGQMEEVLSSMYVDASYAAAQGRDLTPRERAAFSGCSLNGAAAFATSLRHIVEAQREERRIEKQQAAAQGH